MKGYLNCSGELELVESGRGPASYLSLDDLKYMALADSNLVEILRDAMNQGGVEVISHANGFLKLRLRQYSDGSILRLHIWSKEQMANPHNHRWDFVALAIQGRLKEQYFIEVDDNCSGLSFDVYRLVSGRLVATDRTTSYNVISENFINEGDVYYRKASELHSVIAIESNTISLVATAPPNSGAFPLVLAHDGQPTLRDMTPRTLERLEFGQLLEKHLFAWRESDVV